LSDIDILLWVKIHLFLLLFFSSLFLYRQMLGVSPVVSLLMKLACLGKSETRKGRKQHRKKALPGLFAKKAERSVHFWTSSEASQLIKLILHQKRYHWRTLEKGETKLCTHGIGDGQAHKPFPQASILQETHPLEREVERKKRVQLFVHQVSFSPLFVTPVSKPLRRVRQWYQKGG
jgi:hypothetical protein